MSFILFRNGEPLKLNSGESVRYAYLLEQGLTDHQARAVYLSVAQGLEHRTLQAWIKDIKDPKRKAIRSQEINAIVAKSMGVVAEPSSPAKVSTTRKKKSLKSFTLYSRSNHSEAEKRARLAGLVPQVLSGKKPPTGIAEDALSVVADEKTASSLITTGYWTTA
jgi:hypothetical protein